MNLQPTHLKQFYQHERKGDPETGKKGKKGTTVVRYHANIHAALEAAMADGLVGKNAAHKLRPGTEKFIGQFYLPEEAIECIRYAEGTRLELAVLFGLFSLLLRNNVSMKQIQAWLAHSDYGTTANLYAHLDLDASLVISATQLDNGLFGGQPQLPVSSDGQPAEQNEQIKESCQLAADSSQGLSNGATR